jgi:hypothetical protein
MHSRTPEFFNTHLWEWDEPAYSSGTENNSPGSPRANQQGDCSAAGLLSLYSPEPGERIIRKLEVKNRVQVAYMFGQQVNIQVNINEGIQV